jgi:cytochrome P450
VRRRRRSSIGNARSKRVQRSTCSHLFTLSSATDPAAFDNPDRIDLDAGRAPRFAFGGGLRHCLGHFVARADINVALSALSVRMADLRVGEGAEWLPDSGNTGARKLPITSAPRS